MAFFTQHDYDDYDPILGLEANFNALALTENWSKKAKSKYRGELLVGEFNATFGTDTTKLEKWQELCRAVGIEPVPSSITQCRKALGAKDILVNLHDLIDNHRRGEVTESFPSYSAFLKYTRKHTFPLQAAKADGFIKALLRKVW